MVVLFCPRSQRPTTNMSESTEPLPIKWVGHMPFPVKVQGSNGDVITMERGEVITLEDPPVEEQVPYGDGNTTITTWSNPRAEGRSIANFPYVGGEPTAHLNIVVGAAVAPHVPEWFQGGIYMPPNPATRVVRTAAGPQHALGLDCYRPSVGQCRGVQHILYVKK